MIEQLSDGTFKYHPSDLPADATLEELVRLAHQHWAIEQSQQQLKEELGPAHLDGRSRRGLHHHLRLSLLAICFLARLRTSKKRPSLREGHRWLIEALALCCCPRAQTHFIRSGIIPGSS